MSTHLLDGKPVLTKVALCLGKSPAWRPRRLLIFMRLKYIYGKGIGPKFLGHLTEGNAGRVAGFVTEWILVDARPVGPGLDVEGCGKALRRFHELGIKYNNFNLLMREGHDVVLCGFGSSVMNNSLCPGLHRGYPLVSKASQSATQR
ncbi:hypothetical protein C8R42DRAFT_73721 [Lentinula raphanica]|nr:hypothetical protein C8R42DRAFT_73721 [Lentinula raphanica]